ncbi:MAG: TldD/PmbA family protein [Candidatus Bathyarchaeota archaeon]|nr:TldD/PmbA family protein [Candidatus Bathyarchaeota archaeon]
MSILEVSKSMIEEALKIGFDEAACKTVSIRRVMAKFSGEPTITQSWIDICTYLYLARDGRITLCEYRTSDIDVVRRRLTDLCRSAKLIEASPIYAPLPKPYGIKPLRLVDEKIVDLVEGRRDLIDYAWRMVDEASSEEAENYAGVLSASLSSKALATSRGVELHEDSTEFECYLRAFSGDGAGQWAYGGRRLDEHSVMEVGRKAGMYAYLSKNAELIEPGVYDVVLSPMIVGNLVNIVGDMASALQVYLGLSFFSRFKPGDRIASEAVSIYDDGVSDSLPRSTGFDDEGVPTRITAIISEGVFENLLHNSKTAFKFNTESTGNAGWVKPEPWNLRFKPGDLKEDELPSTLGEGLILTNNWYTRLQSYVEGSFSTVARDATFIVKGGKVEKAVKGLRVTGRLHELLSSVEYSTDRCYQIKWWEVETPVLAPYILVRGVRISRPT